MSVGLFMKTSESESEMSATSTTVKHKTIHTGIEVLTVVIIYNNTSFNRHTYVQEVITANRFAQEQNGGCHLNKLITFQCSILNHRSITTRWPPPLHFHLMIKI